MFLLTLTEFLLLLSPANAPDHDDPKSDTEHDRRDYQVDIEELTILVDALLVLGQADLFPLRVAIVDTAAVSLFEGFRLGVPNRECITVVFIFVIAKLVTICNVCSNTTRLRLTITHLLIINFK